MNRKLNFFFYVVRKIKTFQEQRAEILFSKDIMEKEVGGKKNPLIFPSKKKSSEIKYEILKRPSSKITSITLIREEKITLKMLYLRYDKEGIDSSIKNQYQVILEPKKIVKLASVSGDLWAGELKIRNSSRLD